MDLKKMNQLHAGYKGHVGLAKKFSKMLRKKTRTNFLVYPVL